LGTWSSHPGIIPVDGLLLDLVRVSSESNPNRRRQELGPTFWGVSYQMGFTTYRSVIYSLRGQRRLWHWTPSLVVIVTASIGTVRIQIHPSVTTKSGKPNLTTAYYRIRPGPSNVNQHALKFTTRTMSMCGIGSGGTWANRVH
jgi:hypothetical protein